MKPMPIILVGVAAALVLAFSQKGEEGDILPGEDLLPEDLLPGEGDLYPSTGEAPQVSKMEVRYEIA